MSFSAEVYRYGFQEQEQDQETGLVNYKYRMHDPRIGRFFAVDPLAKYYSWNSPYAFSENRVMDAIELEGLESFKLTDKNGSTLTLKHDDMPEDYESNLNVVFDFEGDKEVDMNDSPLPDAFGYSIGVAVDASYLAGGIEGFAQVNVAIFTRGDYSWNPFTYGVVGGKGGVMITPTIGAASVNASVSLWGASFTGSNKELTPQSWEGPFQETSGGGEAHFLYGLGLGVTYFESPGYHENKSNEGAQEWFGWSLDVSGGVGIGAKGYFVAGQSNYTLLEAYPMKTSDLLNSKFGQLRLGVKWAGALSLRPLEGTNASDLIFQNQKQMKETILRTVEKSEEIMDNASSWWESADFDPFD